MAIDLTQFHQVFFEESFEGLDQMETGLLELDPNDVDDETINTIFRAAHSIKGGSATFSFTSVAEFTHVLETLLDEIRAGSRSITQDHIDLFLQSVDCLRDLLSGLQDKEEIDPARADDLRGQFEAILGMDDAADTAEADETSSSGTSGWKISFKPERHIMRTGNEPLRMFWQLAELGKLSIETDTESLPPFTGLSVEDCYFSWELTLNGTDIDRASVEEVFEWVVDDAELLIEPIASSGVPVAEALEEAPAQPENATESTVVELGNTPAEPAKEAAAKPTAKKAKKAAKSGETGSIRVDIDKIDTLINMVGELVITQSMLGEIGSDFTFDKISKLQEGLQDLERNVQVLHESVMSIRMLPISFIFSRFPRMVRDLSRQLDKKIDLVVQGENTELDKTVMEKIGDPLVHLLRNSLDHGIEEPEDRLKAGKDETGIVKLNAFHQGGNIIIEIIDDGRGLNKDKILEKAKSNGLIGEHDTLTDDQINDLIFQPGFSTADVVSDVSGRGVGMDVVRRNIQSLGGHVSVKSEVGTGSTFSISLPLTLAILDGQLVRVGDQTYIFPLVSIIESLSVNMDQVNTVAGAADLLRLREEYIPIIPLYETFGVEPDSTDLSKSLVVVVESDGVKVGLVVDELLAQQQVVIKSLETNYQAVQGISGATILGDGTVSLILDISGVIVMAEGAATGDADEQAA